MSVNSHCYNALTHKVVPRDAVVLSLDEFERRRLRHHAERTFDFRHDTVVSIREQTKPPKPPEPTGLGAVVKDAEGERYVRYAVRDDSAPWYAVEPFDLTRPYRYYSGIDAVEVLNEGVVDE